MYISCLLACLLQRESVDYARVKEYSLRVLQLQPGNTKALYRAGVATLEMGDAQAAKEYLIQVCKEQPNGKQVDVAKEDTEIVGVKAELEDDTLWQSKLRKHPN